jgi:hypothetical protein
MLIDTKQQLLHQAYRQLTAVQKSIVQIFALLGEPTNRERARLCWNEAMLPQQGDRTSSVNASIDPSIRFTSQKLRQRFKISAGQLEGPQFSEEVRVLISRGLLSQQRTEGPRCHDLLVEIVLRDAVLTGTFEPMAQAIEQRLPIRTHY